MKNLYILLLLLTCSCVSVEKAKQKLQKHPLELAEFCSESFPIQEQVIKGEDVVTTDTLYIEGEALECPETTNPETGQVYRPVVQCPPAKTVLQTVTRTDTIIKENTAKVKLLEGQVSQEKAARAKAESASEGKTKWLIGLGIALAAVLSVVFLRR